MYSAVITSAGSGTRAGLGYNKMLFKLDGLTVIERSVMTFCKNRLFDQIIVTVSEADYYTYAQILQDYDVQLVIGGSERMHSVANGVSQATNDFVFIHDGARVFLDDELIARLADYPEKYDGLALAIEVVDTTLLVKNNRVTEVLDRSALFNMQTPQVVNRKVYNQCYSDAVANNLVFTDEVSMLTNYNYDCHIAPGESYNKKLTRPEDFEVNNA
ncbi:IspD/TarI family cytidylyltransferase [Mollicutes bacterium LVI A0039]|nr:IspD/TarI family cytidylyltransferase [Mollicutes bacterium LVI A0039]